MPLLGIDPGSPRYKTNDLTTEPKSRLSDAVVRDWLYTRSYAKSTLCIYTGESAWPITLSTYFFSWRRVTVPIPYAAMTPNVRFRWEKMSNDDPNWALDNGN